MGEQRAMAEHHRLRLAGASGGVQQAASASGSRGRVTGAAPRLARVDSPAAVSGSRSGEVRQAFGGQHDGGATVPQHGVALGGLEARVHRYGDQPGAQHSR